LLGVASVSFTAVFTRDDKGMWLVDLVEEVRVRSYGRTLAAARDGIRHAAATWLDLDPDLIDVIEEIRLPDHVRDGVERALTRRQEFLVAQAAAGAATREAARLLVKSAGLSLRDAADILGLSAQRVQQLLAE